jgi:16S rRNA processing protein RimM
MAEGEYHFQQLIGSQVLLQSGDLIGVVSEIVKLPGQDLLSVNKDGKEVLIPMVKQIIVSIDVETKRIVVNPPEGLLDVAN